MIYYHSEVPVVPGMLNGWNVTTHDILKELLKEQTYSFSKSPVKLLKGSNSAIHDKDSKGR